MISRIINKKYKKILNDRLNTIDKDITFLDNFFKNKNPIKYINDNIKSKKELEYFLEYILHYINLNDIMFNDYKYILYIKPYLRKVIDYYNKRDLEIDKNDKIEVIKDDNKKDEKTENVKRYLFNLISEVKYKGNPKYRPQSITVYSQKYGTVFRKLQYFKINEPLRKKGVKKGQQNIDKLVKDIEPIIREHFDIIKDYNESKYLYFILPKSVGMDTPFDLSGHALHRMLFRDNKFRRLNDNDKIKYISQKIGDIYETLQNLNLLLKANGSYDRLNKINKPIMFYTYINSELHKLNIKYAYNKNIGDKAFSVVTFLNEKQKPYTDNNIDMIVVPRSLITNKNDLNRIYNNVRKKENDKLFKLSENDFKNRLLLLNYVEL